MKLNKNVIIKMDYNCSDVEYNAVNKIVEKYANGTIHTLTDHINHKLNIKFRCSTFKYKRCMKELYALQNLK